MKKASYLLLALFGLISFSAQADVATAEQAAKQYSLQAKSTLSADEGKAFYTKKVVVDGKDLSCSACHTDNPAQHGKHNVTGKEIQPMSPAVNPKRFAEIQKSEKGFTKHCKDLYKKDCSAQDKGNFITYLLSVK